MRRVRRSRLRDADTRRSLGIRRQHLPVAGDLEVSGHHVESRFHRRFHGLRRCDSILERIDDVGASHRDADHPQVVKDSDRLPMRCEDVRQAFVALGRLVCAAAA